MCFEGVMGGGYFYRNSRGLECQDSRSIPNEKEVTHTNKLGIKG